MDSLKIDFLVATINRTNCEFLYPIFKNIDLNDCNVLYENNRYPPDTISLVKYYRKDLLPYEK